MSTPLIDAMPFVTHADLVRFAAEKVNLKREDARAYRDQVNRLREKLDTFIRDHPDYGLIKMLLNGSLAKGLALKILNDIDLALYVNAEKVSSHAGELLDWLVDRLREAYPQMDPEQIQRSRYCVQITFRGTGLKVDVAPVYAIGDQDDHGYLLNKDTGEKVLTSIPRHLKFTRARKERWPDHYAQMVRFAKWWTRQQKSGDPNFRMRSFMCELVFAHVAEQGIDVPDYPSAFEHFFRYIVRSQLSDRIFFADFYQEDKLPVRTDAAIEIFDPVNADNNVSSDYSVVDRQRLLDAAEESLDALAEARFATTQARAVACWQRVLGPSFRG